MRDSAHELPQTPQPARPLQLALQPLYLSPCLLGSGDVFDEGRQVSVTDGRTDHGTGQPDPGDLAVFADQARVCPNPIGRARQNTGKQHVERGLVFRMEKTEEIRAAYFLSRATRQLTVRFVDRDAD